MRYSTLCWLGCIFIFVSCAAHPPRGESEYKHGLSASKYLINTYGEYQTPFAKEYLGYIKERLVSALPATGSARHQYRFILLDTNQPMAFSPGGGFIIFSKGLVKTLANEAEFAFVLCHELAHQQLGHTQFLLRDDSKGGYLPYQNKLELEADRYAIGLMALAGYDPRVAVFALTRSYRALDHIPTDNNYPDLETRLSAINQSIENSKWLPPGTLDRRAFQELRLRL
ncbi:MAG: M48 family metalloprotease [Deltaproteobacteria bacterium]|nr:M48 family metalloprotease [Deltaproteobacteria bacterium]